jgi:hypothetical protein
VHQPHGAVGEPDAPVWQDAHVRVMYRSANVLSGAVGFVHVIPLWPAGASVLGKKPTRLSASSLRTAGSSSCSARKTTNGIISSVASPSEPESNASKLGRLSAITLSTCARRDWISRCHAEVSALGDSFKGSAGLRHAVAIVSAATAAPIAVIDRYLDLI